MMSEWIPNHIDFQLFSREAEGGKSNVARRSRNSIDLYDSSDNPVWIEHPFGRWIDCVALKINDDAGSIIHTNDNDFDHRLLPYVSMDCFIVGYPEGLSGGNDTPIWKRASIASEPSLNPDQKPVVLVDTASRKGMSGSPAIMRHDGVFAPDGLTDDSVFGTVENFLGIYSGRLEDDPMGVQLGRIWKSSVIDEILAANKPGIHPNHVY